MSKLRHSAISARIDAAGAALDSGLKVLWWYYRHYFLEAQLRDLRAREAPEDVPEDVRIPEHERLLNAIDEGVGRSERAFWSQRYAEQLRQAVAAGGPAADAIAVERALLERLIAEAEGSTHPDGSGFVPTSSGDFYVEIPPGDPRLAAEAPRRTGGKLLGLSRGRLAAIAALLVLALLSVLAFVTVMTGPAIAGAPDATAALAAAAPAAPTPTSALAVATTVPEPAAPEHAADPDPEGAWPAEGAAELVDPTSLELGFAQDDRIVRPVVAVAGTLGGAWQPDVQPGGAAWLRDTHSNQVFCLAAADRALLAGATRGQPIIVRSASGMARHYEVYRVRTVERQEIEVLDQRRAGLTLLACGGDAPDRVVVEAVFRPDALSRTVAAAGPVGLGDLLRVELLAAHTLPRPEGTRELPPGLALAEVSVALENLDAQPVGLDDLADQLEVAGAIAEAQLEPRPPLGPHERREVVYRYRVPESGGTARWQLETPGGHAATLAVELPRLAAPEAQLEARIASEQVHLDGALQITIELHNPTPQAIPLRPELFEVWDGPLALPLELQTMPTTVEGGTTATVTLRSTLPESRLVLVRLGQARRWQIELPPVSDH